MRSSPPYFLDLMLGRGAGMHASPQAAKNRHCLLCLRRLPGEQAMHTIAPRRHPATVILSPKVVNAYALNFHAIKVDRTAPPYSVRRFQLWVFPATHLQRLSPEWQCSEQGC